MEEFIALTPIPVRNGFEERLAVPYYGYNTVSGEFTEKSGNFLCTLMDSGGSIVV